MPSLKQPQGWRYLKARLRLLSRPQALGTIAVFLVSGSVLMNYWRRPLPPPAPSLPDASVPALTPAAPLSTLGQPTVGQPRLEQSTLEQSRLEQSRLEQPASPAQSGREPSTPPNSLPPADSIASPAAPAPADFGLLNSPSSPLPAPNLLGESASTRPIDRVPSLPNLDSLTPAPPADPLRRAIPPALIAPAVTPQTGITPQAAIMPQTAIMPRATLPPPTGNSVAPFATSPPPGTTGYVLPPTLAPNPTGLPASRPEVTGATAPPAFRVAPVPAIEQSIGSGQVNP